jgi:hypothetical protein
MQNLMLNRHTCLSAVKRLVAVGFVLSSTVLATGTVARSEVEPASSAVAGAPAQRSSAPARFPLRVVPGRRYLVDAAGRPFLLVGDTAWSLVAQLRADDVRRYLDDRRRRGFNAILVNLLESYFSTAPPLNAYGEAPFLNPGDFGSPNPSYFERVETLLEEARARGILVLLTPAYAGFEGGVEGWWSAMKRSSLSELTAYGRFIATRYRRFDNLMWVQGGDFDPPNQDRAVVEAVARGIRSINPMLQTFHGARGTSAFAYWQPRPRWLDVNTIYTDHHDVVEKARLEYARATRPFFLIEARYENQGFSASTIRRQAYQAILAGGTGAFLGNRPIWSFASGWQDALDSAGARDMANLGRLVRSLEWWRLVPDEKHRLLDGDRGTGANEVLVSVARDRSQAIIYAPKARALTLRLAALRGPRVAATWFDPILGTREPLVGSPFRALGRRTIMRVASRTRDVVLVLESRQ